MNTYAMNTYQSHDLNIAMRTSSGDVIEMDFSNAKASSFNHSEDKNGSETSMSFSSMQSFQFSMETNGIDKQDQKEIKEFMKLAQPFIDDFLKELDEDAPKSPVNKLAHEVASLFEPQRERSDDAKALVKNNIVSMFDNSFQKREGIHNENHKHHAKHQELETSKSIDRVFKDMEKLLEKTLKEFDSFTQNIYA